MKVKNQYLKILEYLHLSFNKWPSIQYTFWVSLVLWNHNNGEDCWLGNDPEDEHWHLIFLMLPFEALHASFCWQALWRCWFHFPAGLGTCPHCQRYQKLVQWPWCYCAWLASKLAWVSMNLWGIVKRKMRDTRPNNADELKATVKETWASIPPQQCHKLITSMPRRIEAVIKAKGAPTKYWVHIQ